MAQVINDPYRSPAANYGASFGAGVSSGLNAMLDKKLQEIQKRGEAENIRRLLPNIQPQQAHALAYLPKELQKPYFEQAMRAPSEEAALEMLQQYMSRLGGGAGAQEAPASQTVQQALGSPEATPEQMMQQQQMQQPPQQKGAFPAGIKPAQAFDIAKGIGKLESEGRKEARELRKEGREERAFVSKEQQSVNEYNKPFNTQLDQEIMQTEPIESLSKEILALERTGKVNHGLSAAFINPTSVAGRIALQQQNPETQAFYAKTNELAGHIASLGKGVQSKYKTELAQLIKPNLLQDTKTVEYLIDSLSKKNRDVFKKREIRERLIKENNGNEPKNLGMKVSEELGKWKKEIETKHKDLPNPAQHVGRKMRNNMGQIVQSDGNSWNPVS